MARDMGTSDKNSIILDVIAPMNLLMDDMREMDRDMLWRASISNYVIYRIATFALEVAHSSLTVAVFGRPGSVGRLSVDIRDLERVIDNFARRGK